LGPLCLQRLAVFGIFSSFSSFFVIFLDLFSSLLRQLIVACWRHDEPAAGVDSRNLPTE